MFHATKIGMVGIITAAVTLSAGVAEAQNFRRPLQSVGEPIIIRASAVASDADRRDQTRFGRNADHELLGQTGRAGTLWNDSVKAREEYGASEDAPDLIFVRVFDAVFGIDPFVRLPQPDTFSEFRSMVGLAATRQIFGETSLETDRTLFDRRRIDRVEELFVELESARQRWLRENGYYRPDIIRRTSDGSGSVAIQTGMTARAKRIATPSGDTDASGAAAQPTASQIGHALSASRRSFKIGRPFALRPSIVKQVRERYGDR